MITADTSLESLEKTAQHLRLTDADGQLKAVEAMVEAKKQIRGLPSAASKHFLLPADATASEYRAALKTMSSLREAGQEAKAYGQKEQTIVETRETAFVAIASAKEEIVNYDAASFPATSAMTVHALRDVVSQHQAVLDQVDETHNASLTRVLKRSTLKSFTDMLGATGDARKDAILTMPEYLDHVAVIEHVQAMADTKQDMQEVTRLAGLEGKTSDLDAVRAILSRTQEVLSAASHAGVEDAPEAELVHAEIKRLTPLREAKAAMAMAAMDKADATCTQLDLRKRALYLEKTAAKAIDAGAFGGKESQMIATRYEELVAIADAKDRLLRIIAEISVSEHDSVDKLRSKSAPLKDELAAAAAAGASEAPEFVDLSAWVDEIDATANVKEEMEDATAAAAAISTNHNSTTVRYALQRMANARTASVEVGLHDVVEAEQMDRQMLRLEELYALIIQREILQAQLDQAQAAARQQEAQQQVQQYRLMAEAEAQRAQQAPVYDERRQQRMQRVERAGKAGSMVGGEVLGPSLALEGAVLGAVFGPLGMAAGAVAGACLAGYAGKRVGEAAARRATS